MISNNYLDIEYIPQKKDEERFTKLNSFLEREGIIFAGSKKSLNHVVDTFILPEDKSFLNDEQERIVNEILGQNLRAITIYKELNHKYYNT